MSTYQKHGDFANFQSGSKDFFLIGSGPWNMMILTSTLYLSVFANSIRISWSSIGKNLTNKIFFKLLFIFLIFKEFIFVLFCLSEVLSFRQKVFKTTFF